jgi:hypothetical protein|uniref:Protein kinase domain-containing protein n=1 Tax=viral metagenome TaxID=1070528 RepID=A0A6C0M166_9ZZZZ
MPFELTYCKCKNSKLFETLENAKIGLRNLQNYKPFYKRFFLLSESNHNSIGLNQAYQLISIADVTNKHVITATLASNKTEDAPVLKIPAFIKYSPLLDPVKYMSGKYDLASPDVLTLPAFGSTTDGGEVHKRKMHDGNNSSYVDAFFTYLSSQTLYTHGFIHGLDFYGSYLANQAEFTVNVYDELDYFSTCDFFLKHKNKLFRIENDEMFQSKPALKLSDMGETLELDDLDALTDLNAAFNDNDAQPCVANVSDLEPLNEEACEECTNDCGGGDCGGGDCGGGDCGDTSDSCSSRSSASSENESMARTTRSRSEDNEDNDNEDNDNDNEDNDNDNEDNEEVDSETERSFNSDDDDNDVDDDVDDDVHNAHIYNFPVHAIVMEKCDNTLDSLMNGRNELTESEWSAALMQIIMTLIAYQRMFAFTHNDLHTNNVMFVKTEKKFLHYLYDGVYYRVPTHGRIMKIIDFGRAIYKYRGQTMVSDSFDRTGDAATQYNCEPYLNPKKPRLDPNPSFDLCRLACSLFDYFVEDIRDEKEYAATLKESRVASMVVEWLKDDKGRNVLYKKNGDERYPEFKLYKMIARTVHGAVPHEQLSKPLFAHYAIARKQINGKPHIMNIDALPCYAQLN